MSKFVVAKIVPETCNTIWEVLQPKYMPTPDCKGWLKIAEDFEALWQFPNCIGSIDGKHITLQAPKNSGSQYFNYKHSHSIVLLAVVDAHYNFIVVDIGAYGSQSDGGIFANSTFGRMLKSNFIKLPQNKPLPGTSQPALPYVLVGDQAFPLMPNLLRPYPGDNLGESKRIYNYRLSRARRIVENAFGILASRFRCFRRPLLLDTVNAMAVVKGAVMLHNFLRKEAPHNRGFRSVDYEDEMGRLHSGEWRREATQQQQMLALHKFGRRQSTQGNTVREHYKDYFVSQAGALPWQTQMVNRLY